MIFELRSSNVLKNSPSTDIFFGIEKRTNIKIMEQILPPPQSPRSDRTAIKKESIRCNSAKLT